MPAPPRLRPDNSQQPVAARASLLGGVVCEPRARSDRLLLWLLPSAGSWHCAVEGLCLLRVEAFTVAGRVGAEVDGAA